MAPKAAFYAQIAGDLNELGQQGRDAEAIDKARRTAEEARAAGEIGFACFFEGEALCLEGNLRAGERLEREAVRQHPEIAFIRANYAVLLSVLGRPAAALPHLSRVLALEPGDLFALSQKSVCLAKLGYGREALACLELMLEQEPDSIYARRNRGVLLARLGREDEALGIFDEILALNPRDDHALSERKIILEELRLKGTPLGWVLLWTRRSLVPRLRRFWHRLTGPNQTAF